MEFLDHIIEILKKPFHEEENKAVYFRNIAAISVFVTLFLYIFKPFDMSNIESGVFWICLGFGAVTFVASIFYDLCLKPLFRLMAKGKGLTFGKWILHTTGIILTISLANFVYARLFFFGYIRWEFFPIMIGNTFAIGIFPVVVLGTVSLLRQEKKYRLIADEINQKEQRIETDNRVTDRTIFDIPLHRIRYVEALQNYVKIGYINPEGQLTERTERGTLKSMLNEVEKSTIVKCHRSFLVNRETIISTSGNAQGLLLTLSECDKIIPVSRSYVTVFRVREHEKNNLPV